MMSRGEFLLLMPISVARRAGGWHGTTGLLSVDQFVLDGE
jgi:hypothetical protein